MGAMPVACSLLISLTLVLLTFNSLSVGYQFHNPFPHLDLEEDESSIAAADCGLCFCLGYQRMDCDVEDALDDIPDLTGRDNTFQEL